jgi:hypothetical protein
MDGGPKITVLAEEDIEEDPDRWCSYTPCGRSPLANRVPMGVESAASTRAADASRRSTRHPRGLLRKKPLLL